MPCRLIELTVRSDDASRSCAIWPDSMKCPTRREFRQVCVRSQEPNAFIPIAIAVDLQASATMTQSESQLAAVRNADNCGSHLFEQMAIVDAARKQAMSSSHQMLQPCDDSARCSRRSTMIRRDSIAWNDADRHDDLRIASCLANATLTPICTVAETHVRRLSRRCSVDRVENANSASAVRSMRLTGRSLRRAIVASATVQRGRSHVAGRSAAFDYPMLRVPS